MKVAVFGGNGMAGHTIAKYLRQQGVDVITVARSDATLHCDIENFPKVASTMLQLEDADYIINCIGLLVKDSINRPDRAAIINGWLPHYLEWWAKDKRTKIIHLSTDCVFDGSKGNYVEGDLHTETNAYGKSKSFGEINNSKDITLRTSIIGTELKQSGTGLLHWFTTTPEKVVTGYENAWWNGITTLQMAKCILNYMAKPTITGVYHLVNNSVNINKYQLLKTIQDVWGLDKEIIRGAGPKEVNKILVDTRLDRDWGIPDYRTQLQELYDFSAGK